MNKRELAQSYFDQGYNCCQSVILAFPEEVGLSESQLALLGSPFGGGLARLREICGAVSGMAIVAGLRDGYESPTDGDAKAAHYELVRKLIARFKEENGCYICRDLLASHPAPAQSQSPHNPACNKFVGDAAAILEEYIQE